MDTLTEFDYDVAFSFAGEDRGFVEVVATFLKEKGVKVFYDKFEETNLWGKDLVIHFDVLYSRKAKYCIPIISKYYKLKAWTNHELKSALSRAIHSSTEYILPAKFDDTEIEGIRSTMSYIDLRQHSPESFAEIILKKLDKAQIFNGEEVIFRATAKMSIGLPFAPNEKRIPTLGIEIINKTKEPRFFKEPFFQLNKQYNNFTHFGLINRDLIGIFPFKLEYGEARLLHYYLDDIHGIVPKMFSEIEDDVDLTAVISTTVDEKVISNKVLAKEIKEQFKFFRDAD